MYDKTLIQYLKNKPDQSEELFEDMLELLKSFTDEGMDAKKALQATGIIGTHMTKSALEIHGYDTSTFY